MEPSDDVRNILCGMASDLMNNKTYTEAIGAAMRIEDTNTRYFILGYIEGAWETVADYV